MGCSVNEAKCRDLAGLLKSVHLPDEKEEYDIATYLDAREASNFYMLVVSICHQTQSLEGTASGKHWRGWDYLTQRLLQYVSCDRSVLEPTEWISMPEVRLREVYSCKDYGSTLSDVSGRAELVRDMGKRLIEGNIDSLLDLYHLSDRTILGEEGLVTALAKLDAYRDPVRKKTYFLLGLTQASLGWSFRDEHNLGAPVDYHEIRGHLRLGTVTIDERAILERLSQNTITQQDDALIRSAVFDAMNSICAHLDGVTPMQLHYLLWNYFRSVCTRTKPNCSVFLNENRLPERYKDSLGMYDRCECKFSSVCESRLREDKPNEYSLITNYY
jgi:hypothetical protein